MKKFVVLFAISIKYSFPFCYWFLHYGHHFTGYIGDAAGIPGFRVLSHLLAHSIVGRCWTFVPRAYFFGIAMGNFYRMNCKLGIEYIHTFARFIFEHTLFLEEFGGFLLKTFLLIDILILFDRHRSKPVIIRNILLFLETPYFLWIILLERRKLRFADLERRGFWFWLIIIVRTPQILVFSIDPHLLWDRINLYRDIFQYLLWLLVVLYISIWWVCNRSDRVFLFHLCFFLQIILGVIFFDAFNYPIDTCIQSKPRWTIHRFHWYLRVKVKQDVTLKRFNYLWGLGFIWV